MNAACSSKNFLQRYLCVLVRAWRSSSRRTTSNTLNRPPEKSCKYCRSVLAAASDTATNCAAPSPWLPTPFAPKTVSGTSWATAASVSRKRGAVSSDGQMWIAASSNVVCARVYTAPKARASPRLIASNPSATKRSITGTERRAQRLVPSVESSLQIG